MYYNFILCSCIGIAVSTILTHNTCTIWVNTDRPISNVVYSVPNNPVFYSADGPPVTARKHTVQGDIFSLKSFTSLQCYTWMHIQRNVGESEYSFSDRKTGALPLFDLCLTHACAFNHILYFGIAKDWKIVWLLFMLALVLHPML